MKKQNDNAELLKRFIIKSFVRTLVPPFLWFFFVIFTIKGDNGKVGLYPGGLITEGIFCYQTDGPINGGAYNRGSYNRDSTVYVV